MSFEFSKQLKATDTPINGLVVYDLPVHGDNRGWFKENWQKAKMTALGLPDFGPVQNNVSFNDKTGVTRGLHAEPWDKFVSIGSGRIFGAWCDLRAGSATYGKTFTVELDPSRAIYVPRGVANGYQTLEDNTVYMYLVNDHWTPDGKYSFVNVADRALAIDWPIPLDQAELSDKDRAHPNLADVTPLPAKKVLITGANGQLGQALAALYPDAECVDRDSFDIGDPAIFLARDWRQYSTIINAAAYTAVDAAETDDGRLEAWQANSVAPANLSLVATQNNLTLVHISSDYVFNGTEDDHTETEPFSPLGVYGQTKAAGDIAVALAPRHYIMRTSWVIGTGNNFVRTMKSLADKGVKPSVVNDQIGRLTFTEDLAGAIKHLTDSDAAYGTYNVSNSGESASWADIAKLVYEHAGHDADEVSGVTTKQYYEGKGGIAPRPLRSSLDLSKLVATGFTPRDWRETLDEYVKGLEAET